MVKDVTDLEVYKSSLSLLERVYTVAYSLPHLKLRTQLINSAEAIAPLLAEGFAKRKNQKESARFYEIAMGESDEVQAHLAKAMILAKRFSKVSIKECEQLFTEYKILSKRINRMIKVWTSFTKNNNR